jgi:hypothetical protein
MIMHGVTRSFVDEALGYTDPHKISLSSAPQPTTHRIMPTHPTRQLTDHKLNGLNEQIDIVVLDAPGPGGANHHYDLILGDSVTGAPVKVVTIEFQNGPIAEAGSNGFTNEALLAVVIDRMRGFQSGQFACRDNAIALTHLEDALMRLQKRTRDRLARGVEGTNKV